MWIFSMDGFFSVVSKHCGPDEVLVRTRRRSDMNRFLERIGRTDIPVLEISGSDYAFRTKVPRDLWAEYLSDHASADIDYDNFRVALELLYPDDSQRREAYHRVYEIMAAWQDEPDETE